MWMSLSVWIQWIHLHLLLLFKSHTRFCIYVRVIPALAQGLAKADL